MSYFTTNGNAAALLRAVSIWTGTPFHPNGRVPGPRGGCSCESLVLSLYVESGWLPPDYTFPRGSIRHYRANRQSLILPFIEEHLLPKLCPQERTKLALGDLLYFADDSFEHLGIALNSREFIHCLKPQGVHLSLLADGTYSQRLRHAWQPL